MLPGCRSSGDESAGQHHNIGTKSQQLHQQATTCLTSGTENPKTSCKSEPLCRVSHRIGASSGKLKPMTPSGYPIYSRIPSSLEASCRGRKNTGRLNSPKHRLKSVRCVHSDDGKAKLVCRDGGIRVRKVRSASARLNDMSTGRLTQTAGDGLGAVREQRRSMGFDFKAGERSKCGCYTCSGGAVKYRVVDESKNSLDENQIVHSSCGAQFLTEDDLGGCRTRSTPVNAGHQDEEETVDGETYRSCGRAGGREMERQVREGMECSKGDATVRQGSISENVGLRRSDAVNSSTKTTKFWDRRRKRVRISSDPIYFQSPGPSPRFCHQESLMYRKEFLGPSILRVKESNQSLPSVSSQSTLCSKDSTESISNPTGSSSVDSMSNNEAYFPHNIPSSIYVSAANKRRSVRMPQGSQEDFQHVDDSNLLLRTKNYHSDSEILSEARITQNSTESAINLQTRSSETQVGFYNQINSRARHSLTSLLSSRSQKMRTSLIPVSTAGGSSYKKPLSSCHSVEKLVLCSKPVSELNETQSTKGRGRRCSADNFEKCSTDATDKRNVSVIDGKYYEHTTVERNVELEKDSVCRRETKVIRVPAKAKVDLEKPTSEAVTKTYDMLSKRNSEQSLNDEDLMFESSPGSRHLLSNDNSTTDLDANVPTCASKTPLDLFHSRKEVPRMELKSNRAVSLITQVMTWIDNNLAAGHVTPRDERSEQSPTSRQIEDLIAGIQGWDVARFVNGDGLASILSPCDPADVVPLSSGDGLNDLINSTLSSSSAGISERVDKNEINVKKDSKSIPGKKDTIEMIQGSVIDIEDTLFTRRLTAQFQEAVMEEDSEKELEKLRDLLCRLPAENMYVLEWLITRHVIRLENCQEFGELLKIDSKVLVRLVELGDTVFEECF